MLNELALDQMAERCRHLRPNEKKALALAEEIKGIVAQALPGLATSVNNDAFTVALPTRLHYAGRTRGGKNTTGIPPLEGGGLAGDGLDKVKRWQRDSEDLQRAALDDIAHCEGLLGITGDSGAATFTVSDDCLKKIKQAFNDIRSKTDADYEADFRQNQKALEQLDHIKFSDKLDEMCGPASAAN